MIVLILHYGLFALVLYRFGLSLHGLGVLFLTEGLIVLAIIDWHTGLLPDCLTLSLLWMGLALNILHFYTDIESAVLGAMVGYVSLWSLYRLFKLATGKDGMGYGDFKLLAALGAWMGWQALPLILFLASSLSLFAVLWRFIITRSWQVKLPFGPGLALAAYLFVVYKPYFSTIF
ncbi:MAG: A24 family peptidase [Gammaproteobacteria bacterium]|nr:A24 family peptidase [Gammaproteobacteria bacterium]